MSNPRNNRRPNPRQDMAAVYRRRRIVVGGVLLVLIIAVVLIFKAIFGFIGGFFHHGAAATPSPTVTATAGGACAPGAVTVLASVGNASQQTSNSFAKSDTPYLWFSLTNNSTAPCTFDAGSAVSYFKITSGSTTIWDSHDCDRTAATNNPIMLQPGATVSSQPSSWMKVFSSSTGCSTGQKSVPTKGASYHLIATVNGIQSSDVQFVLK